MRLEIWTTILWTTAILTTTQSRHFHDDDDDATSSSSASPGTNQDNNSSESALLLFSHGHGRFSKDKKTVSLEKREIDGAIEFGLDRMRELLEVKEPQLYKLGLYLDKNEPASHVADFGAPSKKALLLSTLGYAALEASKKIAKSLPEDVSRQAGGIVFEKPLLNDECPLRGVPRCRPATRRYRTADGTCNSFKKPWRGAALLPFQRFLPPVYQDGLQEVRRSIFNNPLPSAREISHEIHRDKNFELATINLMFMQWGQFIDHDLTSTVKSRSFNGSIPRCCQRNAQAPLPLDLQHPSCLPIPVSRNDRFLSRFGIGCLEFIRSAPSTRIDCDLGWREQINQVTSYLDGSAVYGSDVETSDSIRTFKRGKLFYGRPQGREPLQPPDPPGGELCRSGALTSDCFQGADGRFSEQPGLIALHTVFLRYHNRLAEIMSQLNEHWSDEKVFQETRRVIVGIIQHITYREFLPIVLGQEVMELFELNTQRKGYYTGYDERVNPVVSNAFSTAAFRFGHSLVQNSYVRFDSKHRPLFNNVSLHEEQENIENIWSFGSLDRILLGFCNQASQQRDEFMCDELTNHLFQSRGARFGLDLAAINIQRGRDHGLPPYTSWREPCGLKPIKTWQDLEKIMNLDTVKRLKLIYEHFDDIDLFTGGLAEKPVRGGTVGPTFACIIAQQFLNLKKGDRFWYENGGFESSLTPAQLQQIRHVTLAHVLCQTLTEIETIQPFVFLTADNLRNLRLSCESPIINNFDLSPWIEESNNIDRIGRKKKKKKNKNKTTERPLKIKITNVTTQTVNLQDKEYGDIPKRPTFSNNYHVYNTNKRRTSTTPRYDDVTYLFGYVRDTTTQRPIEVNIKIQYYPPPTTTTTTKRPYSDLTSYSRPDIYSDDFIIYRPTNTKYEDRPFSTSKRPYIYRPNSNHYIYNDVYSTRRPYYDNDRHETIDRIYSQVYQRHPLPPTDIDDKLDFQSFFTRKDEEPTKFVKISSVKGGGYVRPLVSVHDFHVAQREGDLDLSEEPDNMRLVGLEVAPDENRWKIYNATEEADDSIIKMPDLNVDVTCSNEIPRPMIFRNVPEHTTKT